ncbi:membrane protein [Planotetraspora phitsanulokensis]|uniref:Membrane protein n=2 Tax=Planotetraspora phitsanulokensis TaxID=575192 RepID=A0A8J3XMS6_9ACTN|nr:endonuclease/exonuclease/phosphatase family protein [Planotetraspora phitsanulokensis]GII42018.1 membrane protein [Planotetraspora phitsanulokensis]
MTTTADATSREGDGGETDERRRENGMWRRGRIIGGVALLPALVMVLHAHIPNRAGNIGSLTETFLPWTGLAVPLLAAFALARRSATALVALTLPAVIWLALFGRTLLDKRSDGGDLIVASHNVNNDNPDPEGTARALIASGADVVGLEELTASAIPVYEKALAGAYRYHAIRGTVGLWSKYPMSDTHSVGIMEWSRALRSTVQTPHGPLAVFVAHLPSVRVNLDAGFTADQRDASARLLAEAVRDDPVKRTVLVGDFNGTAGDRALSPVTSQMRSAQAAAGDGFGFSWPAAFPMARIDQILVRGVEPVSSWTLPATRSDHLPVAASIGF